MVSLMMDSGLPCFKGSPLVVHIVSLPANPPLSISGDITIRKLKERFLPEKSERQAAEFMMGCIRQSHENVRRFVRYQQ